MDAAINANDDDTLPLTPEALHSFAGELPLEILLLEMRHFYGAGDDPSANLDYDQICAAWIDSLDDRLRRLETDAP